MAGAIWRVRDRLGREVALTEGGWAHILDGHDELVDRVDDVRAAVEQADFIDHDARYAPREVHSRPVPPQGTWAGTVVTAYVVGKPKPGEKSRWP